MVEHGSSKPRDDLELLALREQVTKLSFEKAALQEKKKEDIQGQKKVSVCLFKKQSSNLIHCIHKSFLFTKCTALKKIVKD